MSRNWQPMAEAFALPLLSLAGALVLFGIVVALGGRDPVAVWRLLFVGAFGDAFSWQNTLQRSAPLMLTALCVALPAQAGLVIIGGEGALVLGGLAMAGLPYLFTPPAGAAGTALLLVGAALASGGGHKASLWWVMGFEVLNSIGFANVFPVGLALYARAAPKALVGTLIGVYYLHLFMCNNLVGWLGGVYERLPGEQFWLLQAALMGAAALLMAVAARLSGHLLEGQEAG